MYSLKQYDNKWELFMCQNWLVMESSHWLMQCVRKMISLMSFFPSTNENPPAPANLGHNYEQNVFVF